MDPRFLDADWSYVGLIADTDRPCLEPGRRLFQKVEWIRPNSLSRHTTDSAEIRRLGGVWDTLKKNLHELATALESFRDHIPIRHVEGFMARNISACAGIRPLAERDADETYPFTDKILGTYYSDEEETDLVTGGKYRRGEMHVIRTRHIPMTPEESASANPQHFVDQADQIRRTFTHHNNPLADEKKREWIARFIVERLSGLAIAKRSTKEIEGLLLDYYNYDHRGLVAAWTRPKPEEKPQPPEEWIRETFAEASHTAAAIDAAHEFNHNQVRVQAEEMRNAKREERQINAFIVDRDRLNDAIRDEMRKKIREQVKAS